MIHYLLLLFSFPSFIFLAFMISSFLQLCILHSYKMLQVWKSTRYLHIITSDVFPWKKPLSNELHVTFPTYCTFFFCHIPPILKMLSKSVNKLFPNVPHRHRSFSHGREIRNLQGEKKRNVGNFTLRDNVIIPNWSQRGYGGTLNISYFTSVHTGQVSRNIHVLDSIRKKWPISDNGKL